MRVMMKAVWKVVEARRPDRTLYTTTDSLFDALVALWPHPDDLRVIDRLSGDSCLVVIGTERVVTLTRVSRREKAPQ